MGCAEPEKGRRLYPRLYRWCRVGIEATVVGDDGVEWLYDANNKNEAIAILRKYLPQMSPELAAQSYAVLAGPKGFARKAELDIDGVRRVLELRSEYGQPKKALSDPTRYYDPKYYQAATR